MGQPATNTYSLETYFQLERENQEAKYEYHDGKIVAMAGVTRNHAQLSVRITTALETGIFEGDKPCRVFSSDMRVAIETLNRRYYPDASVSCGPDEINPLEPNSVFNPLVVVEVLSPGTESFNRSEKFWPTAN